MNRIDAKFTQLRKLNKKALIVYLTSGYPDLLTTGALVLELEKRGVDIIELGVPFSDPLADGPVIQAASEYALSKNKINLTKIFSLVKNLRKKTEIPISLMTYYNPVFSFGVENFIRESAACGVDGVIIPDLPPEEAQDLIRWGKKKDLSTVFFLSPTSSIERVKLIARVSRGFIYYVSLTGVTGARVKIAADLARNIRGIKKYTRIPVCAGFGISDKQQVGEIFKTADGAILGSKVISLIRDNMGKKDLVEKVGKFVGGLK